jgi:hypothetical protein
MTTIDLGKRAVACKKWRWKPGMFTTDGYRCVSMWRSDIDGHELRLVHDVALHHEDIDATSIPDLSDPATLGCLLALVREAWSTAASPRPGLPGYDAGRIYVEPHAGGWHACWPNGTRLGSSRTENTETEALVAALEAAP